MHGCANRRRAVGQHGDLHRGGQGALELRQELLDPVDHLDQVGAGLPLDIDDDRRLVAHPRGLSDVLGAVDHLGHVREQERRVVAVGDHERAILMALVDLVVGRDGEGLERPVEAPLRLVDVGGGDGGTHVLHREAIGGEPRRVHLDAYRRLLTARQGHEPDTGELRDLLHEPRVGEILDGRERQRPRRRAERQHRRVGRIDLAVHGRVREVTGQERGGRVDGRLHLLLGDVDRERQIELQGHDGRAARADRRHLLEARQLAELPLERRGDARGHDVGARARIERDDLDGRVVDLRERGDGQLAIRHDAGEHDRRRQERRRHGPDDELAGEVHAPGRGVALRTVGSTRAPS